MKRHTYSCFVSYSHVDMDRDTLDYVLQVLQDSLGSNVKIYFDGQVEIGKSFDDFTNLLTTVDAAILILTPSYKERINSRIGGVFDEFTTLWIRYSNNQEQFSASTAARKIDHFEILPVLFSGIPETSIPEELESLKYLDLRKLRVKRKKSGEYIVGYQDKRMFESLIQEMSQQLLASFAMRSEEYRTLTSTFYDDLFVDLKASWDRSVDGRNLVETQFVKTRSYYKIDSQQACFMVGRKGSGKSTLAQVLPLIHPDRYQDIIRIIADQINLETLYALYSDQQFRSDTNSTISRQRAFEYTWEAVIVLSLMNKFTTDENLILSARLNPTLIQPIKELLDSIKGDRDIEWRTVDFFSYCFTNMVRFVRECIDGARNDPQTFYADIGVRFSQENYFRFIFTESAYDSFMMMIRSFARKFLVTLDGFDTAFDEFRLNSIRTHNKRSLQRRAYFEIDWLRSLLNLTIQAKTKTDNFLYRILDFCIVAPVDRFMEVVRIERDSYRHLNRWFEIQWSGIELTILLRKRLEGISNFRTNLDKSPQLRLEEVWQHEQFKHISFDIEFEFNNKKYQMPLFLYVLRHTFWRPRDILLYFGRILALAENMKKWGDSVGTEAIRKCVKITTRQVIESEFIGEYRSTIVNIEDILGAFRRCKWTLDFQTLRGIVNSQIFRFATSDLTESDLVAKIHFLYSIGFIGLQLSTEQQTRLGLWHQYAFQFNEGESIFGDRLLDEVDLAEFTYAIHPIFVEYLLLDTTNSDLILSYDWQYLQRSEAALVARQGG